MARKTQSVVLSLVAGLVVVLLAGLSLAQEVSVSPSVRFEKGLALLKEKSIKLVVEYAREEGSKLIRETITSYSDMVLLVNTKTPMTFYLVGPGEAQERKLATLKPNELPSKALGAWIWYKICAAADLLESCRAVGIIS